MIKILVADDHELIREGFKKLIAKESDMSVVAEAENAAEVLNLIGEIPCDIIVLDLIMPGRGGLDVLQELKTRAPRSKILILSMYPENEVAVRTLKVGASGYITKETASDELLGAIRKVYEGGRYVSSDLAEKLAFDLDAETEKRPHEKLSNREFQVLQLIGSGKTGLQIAGELSLSVNTVNTYRKRILEKMNMKSSAELIHYAIRNKLVVSLQWFGHFS